MSTNLIRNFGTSSSFQYDTMLLIPRIDIDNNNNNPPCDSTWFGSSCSLLWFATGVLVPFPTVEICLIFHRSNAQWNEAKVHYIRFLLKLSAVSVFFSLLNSCPGFVMTRWQCVDVTADTYILILLFEKSVRWTVRIDFAFFRFVWRMKVQRLLCIYVMWNRNWMVESSSEPVEIFFYFHIGSNVMLRPRDSLNHFALLSFIFLQKKKSRSQQKQRKFVVVYCMRRK